MAKASCGFGVNDGCPVRRGAMGLGLNETVEAVLQFQDVGLHHLTVMELCGRLKELDGKVQEELARTEAPGMEVLGVYHSKHTVSLLIALLVFVEPLESQGVASASS
jgi:hypothetical protein